MTEQTEDIARKEAYRLLDEGVRLLNAGRYGEALDALRQADDLLPDDPDIMITLSGAMIMAGKWNAAERFLEEAVTKRPENPRLWLNLAAARLGIDPALVSGPLMSTLVDATGLFIYFTIAGLILGL